jgi:hypothetical protein
MQAWEAGLFALDAPHPQWQVGQTVTYTVLRHGHRLSVPVTLVPYLWQEVAGEEWSLLLFLVVFGLVGTYVFVRRPTDRTAPILFLSTSTLLAHNTVWAIGMQVSDITGGLGFWLRTIMALVVNPVSFAALLHFALLFPRVHPVLRGRRWLIPSLYTFPFVANLVYLATTRALARGTLDWIAPGNLAGNVLALLYAILIVLVWVSNVRARHLDALARQQTRLLSLAAMFSAGCFLLLWILPADVLQHPIINLNALGLLLLPIPIALAIAILRYGIFDIDVLINRALVYGTLTAILAAVYFAVVLGAQFLGERLTGQTAPPAWLIVITTLLVAALFTPLRGRLQAGIDRRFYRSKYDAARTLEAFAATLRTETDLEELRRQLVEVVEGTMQPAHVSLWLRAPERKPTAGRATTTE